MALTLWALSRSCCACLACIQSSRRLNIVTVGICRLCLVLPYWQGPMGLDSDRQPMGRFGNWNEFHQPGGISDGDVAEIRLDFGVIKSVHASNCLLSSILSLIHQYHQLCCFSMCIMQLEGISEVCIWSFGCHLSGSLRSLLSDAEGCRRTQGGASVTLQLAEGTKVSRGIPLPSGKHIKSYWKWPFIVDFPMKNGDFP